MDYEKKIAEKEARRQELFKLKEPIDAELSKLYKEIESLRDKQSKEKLKEEMSFEERFLWLMQEDGCSSDMTRHKAAEKMLHDMGFWMSGYYTFSQQKAIELMLCKGKEESLTQTLENLTKILPLIKPMNEEGHKRFKIFEHTLSESGIYDLWQQGDDWVLEKTTHGRTEELKRWGNLKEALAYIQQHHYYESVEDEEEDD